MQTRRVLLVDSDEAVLRSVERLVHRIKTCVRAAAVADANYAIANLRLCGLIVEATVDIPRDGLDLVSAFRAANPCAPILILTRNVCNDTIDTAFDANAKVVIKGRAAHRIKIFAIECACADTDHLPVVRDVLADWARRAKLTLKEVEVFEGALRERRAGHFVAAGLSLSAYAARRTSLLRKLGYSTVDEAVADLLREALRRAVVLEIAV